MTGRIRRAHSRPKGLDYLAAFLAAVASHSNQSGQSLTLNLKREMPSLYPQCSGGRGWIPLRNRLARPYAAGEMARESL
jgi:hypothetical protein